MTETHAPALDLLPFSTRVALGVALGVSILALGLQALLPTSHLHRAQARILQFSLLLVMGAFLARAKRDPAHRRGWLMFTAMFGIHLLATLAREWVSGPLLRLAIVLYLPLGVAGFLGWNQEPLLWAGGIRRVLEGLIFAGSNLTLTLLGLQGLSYQGLDRLWWDFVGVGIPSVLLGMALFHVRVHPNRLKGPIGWMGLYLFQSSLMNYWQVGAIQAGAWSSSHPIAYLDPLAPLVAGLASVATWPPEIRTREEGRGQHYSTGIMVYIPFMAALVWVLVRVWNDSQTGQPADPALTILMGGITILLIIRQVIALRDQASFSRILETKLEQQRVLLQERESALLRTQRLNLVATVGAGMAHDLNNLLGGLCALAERGAQPEELVLMAHRAAALARKSMAHASDPGQSRALFDLRESMEALSPLLKRFAGKGIRLEFNLPDVEAWVETDPLLVEQAMVNLVTNARDALSGQGQIVISLEVGDETLILTVSDDGPGIPEDQIPRIFEPFYTTKASGSGTGLGLPSVKAFVESLGGGIEVRSEPGQGTAFALQWPRLAGC